MRALRLDGLTMANVLSAKAATELQQFSALHLSVVRREDGTQGRPFFFDVETGARIVGVSTVDLERLAERCGVPGDPGLKIPEAAEYDREAERMGRRSVMRADLRGRTGGERRIPIKLLDRIILWTEWSTESPGFLTITMRPMDRGDFMLVGDGWIETERIRLVVIEGWTAQSWIVHEAGKPRSFRLPFKARKDQADRGWKFMGSVSNPETLRKFDVGANVTEEG